MGKRGPRPTPTPILRMRGSWRAADREAGGPTPQYGTPDCPAYLSLEGKNEWARLVPILERMGVITLADCNVVARYCDLWAEWKACVDFVAQHGPTRPAKNQAGEITGVEFWPHVGMKQALHDRLIRLEQELGLSPSARAGLKVAPLPAEKEDDGKARFFAAAG